MAIKEIYGMLSVACSLAGYGVYLWSIYRGGVKPHAFSWIVWTILMGIIFFVQLGKEAGPGCWVTGSSAATCLIIAILALVRGEKNITRSDWLAFAGALIAIPIWRMTKNPLGAVLFITAIDAMAYYPTFRKSWLKPYEESSLLYSIDCIKWIIAFFAFTDYSFVTLFYPSFCFTANASIVTMIIARRLTTTRAVLTALFCVVLGASVPAFAQDLSGITAVYDVSDVAVDVTADSAAHARDQAIIEAQHKAFSQLLVRLSADEGLAAKLKNDDLATLVQNFEVQSERVSSVRYIGTFTVQFRPNAVRKFLNSRGVTVSDTRSAPVVVLPITNNDNHPKLWEDATHWHAIWDKAPHDDGLVPVVLPAGGLDDIALISTEEAASGRAENLKALAEKYQAGGVVVATLNGNIDNPASGLSVDVTRYNADGVGSDSEHIKLPALTDKNAVDDALAAAVRQVRHQLEKAWQETQKVVAAQPTIIGGATAGMISVAPVIATVHLPVTVPVATLAEWAATRRILSATPGILNVNVITVGRGEVMVELEMNTSIPMLQNALAQQKFNLSQSITTQAWFLRRF